MKEIPVAIALAFLGTAVSFSMPGSASAQTGKIAGVIIDAATGESLPGVNVLVVGTTRGSASDEEGVYFINNVRPGTYTVRASFLGFVTQTTENVRVSAGLTTTVDMTLREERLGLEEIVVTSEAPVVQPDVSANVANLDPSAFEDLPVAGVSDVLDLQAGIEPGLQVRGGGLDEVAFVVDGLNLRTGRDHEPFTNISYTALEAVQVQTGGFNAEYGNVRAGIVTVTTREPPRDRYTFDGIFRLTPPQDKSFDALRGSVLDGCDYASGVVSSICDSFWIRPALDPSTAFDGTAYWDPYTQRQYNVFEGWNNLVEGLRNKGFDVTAQDMVDHFLFTHRKDNTITSLDYEADVTVGGPLLPGVGERLGDLRFLFSYRGQQTAYTLPQTRDAYDANTFQGKLTANIARGMTLTLHGMRGTERGVIPSGAAAQVSIWKGDLPAYPWFNLDADPVTRVNKLGASVFSDGAFGLGNIDHTLLGISLTHALNASTFYEVSLQDLHTRYRHRFPNLRDGSFLCPASGVGPDDQPCSAGEFVALLYTDSFGRANGLGAVTCFGGASDLNGDGVLQPYCAGDEPFGFAGTWTWLPTGESTGGADWNATRDTTDIAVFTGRIDLTSQVNRYLQVKTGAELIVSRYDVNARRIIQAFDFYRSDFDWERSPLQAAAYMQGKLEFEGMIANLGARLDYFDANSAWWVLDNPYDPILREQEDALDERLPTAQPEAQVFLSPRLGMSFPITENSKLYFNYGHFRQMLNPFDVFGVESSVLGGIDVLGNPEHPMPLTVAYELGFDQNLFDRFLLRLSGFYRDIRQQPRSIRYEGLGAFVEYRTFEPWNYEDNRGFEVTLTKNRGRWLRGFVNYTFLQRKEGNFGYAEFYENSFDQLVYQRTATDYRLFTPIAEPYARMNLILLTPADFGPDAAGFRPLADWRVSLLGEWRSGEQWTWYGGGPSFFPELSENVAWQDYWNVDLRLARHLKTRLGDVQLFFDIDNVFNRKHLYNQAAFLFSAGSDFDYYMWSLHLPGDIFDTLNHVTCAQADVAVADCPYEDKHNLPYFWVPGHDQPGDFRTPGVAYQPVEAFSSLEAVTDPNEIAWYWAADTEQYARWNGSAWEAVPDEELQQALDDKAYIDMPNLRFNTFLNPRRVTLGIRVRF